MFAAVAAEVIVASAGFVCFHMLEQRKNITKRTAHKIRQNNQQKEENLKRKNSQAGRKHNSTDGSVS